MHYCSTCNSSGIYLYDKELNYVVKKRSDNIQNTIISKNNYIKINNDEYLMVAIVDFNQQILEKSKMCYLYNTKNDTLERTGDLNSPTNFSNLSLIKILNNIYIFTETLIEKYIPELREWIKIDKLFLSIFIILH